MLRVTTWFPAEQNQIFYIVKDEMKGNNDNNKERALDEDDTRRIHTKGKNHRVEQWTTLLTNMDGQTGRERERTEFR